MRHEDSDREEDRFFSAAVNNGTLHLYVPTGAGYYVVQMDLAEAKRLADLLQDTIRGGATWRNL